MMHLELVKKDSGLFVVPAGSAVFEIGIAAKNCNSVNYSNPKPKIRRYEKYLIHFQTGITQDKIFFLDQEHGDAVVVADAPYPAEQVDFAKGDALVTNVPGFCLVIRTADCFPIFLVDETNRIAGAVHSGWRSTEKNITAKTVSLMKERFGSDPAGMKAYILPGIGADHYEVSEDVAKKFAGCYTSKDGKFFLDLKLSIYNSLRKSGLVRENIYASYQDTFGFNDTFFSHRRGDAGRNLNYMYLL
jgi:polyphenol oxidase